MGTDKNTLTNKSQNAFRPILQCSSLFDGVILPFFSARQQPCKDRQTFFRTSSMRFNLRHSIAIHWAVLRRVAFAGSNPSSSHPSESVNRLLAATCKYNSKRRSLNTLILEYLICLIANISYTQSAHTHLRSLKVVAST